MRPREIRHTSRFDNLFIASLIQPSARVLDLGCGEGDLLELLVRDRQVIGSGVEKDEQAIYRCVEKGLSVSRLDIDSGLDDYPDDFFDFVIMNQVLEQILYPRRALRQALRAARNVIVGFPNFCHFSIRFQILFQGRVPITPILPYSWYDSPNLHFLSVKDFLDFCDKEKIAVERKFFIASDQKIRVLPNLRAEKAIMLLRRSFPLNDEGGMETTWTRNGPENE